MTRNISKEKIHQAFIQALSNSIRDHPAIDKVPLEVQACPPLPPKLRVYGFSVSRPGGGNEEYTARIKLPEQTQGERGSFNHSDGHFVLLLGYSEQTGVFILWDAGLHRNFSYGKGVRVKSGPVFEAVAGDIGTQERHLSTGTEKVLTANAKNLSEAISLRSELTTQRLISQNG